MQGGNKLSAVTVSESKPHAFLLAEYLTFTNVIYWSSWQKGLQNLIQTIAGLKRLPNMQIVSLFLESW